MIVVGVVLIIADVSVHGVSALPIVGAGVVQFLFGLYKCFTPRRDHRAPE
jgi:hypothetical protein